jgi:hypothetical protein
MPTAGRHRRRGEPAAPARLAAARRRDRQDLRAQGLRPSDHLRQRGRRRSRGGRPPPRHRHPLEQGHPGTLQPRRGWADRQRLPARRPNPTTRPARAGHRTFTPGTSAAGARPKRIRAPPSRPHQRQERTAFIFRARAPPTKAVPGGRACRGQQAGPPRQASSARRTPLPPRAGVPGPHLGHTPLRASGHHRYVHRAGRRCDPGG